LVLQHAIRHGRRDLIGEDAVKIEVERQKALAEREPEDLSDIPF